jgi:hypothetical protein
MKCLDLNCFIHTFYVCLQIQYFRSFSARINSGLRGEYCLRQSSNPLKYNICRQFYE